MRIGILTLPLHANYGGLLQAYALQTVLERMGHNVVVFDSPNHMHISGLKKCFAYPKRCVDKYLLGKNIKITKGQGRVERGSFTLTLSQNRA